MPNAKGAGGASAALRLKDIEWPTMWVFVLSWTFWLALVVLGNQLHPLIFILLAGFIGTWHASFQHEAIHGHPTTSERLNRALAMPSMVFWMSYEDYRSTHLAHHVNENLTHPDLDPESFYQWEYIWSQHRGPMRWILRANNTLVGRMSIGAVLMVGRCAYKELKGLLRLDRHTWAMLSRHWLASLPMVIIAIGVFNVPWWVYFLGFGLAPASWLCLRSFLEHEASEGVGRRTAMVYDNLLPASWPFTGFFSLLFLNNNLHVAHHAAPRVPWYELPRHEQENRQELIDWNEDNKFHSYGEVIGRFSMRTKKPVAHPILRKQL